MKSDTARRLWTELGPHFTTLGYELVELHLGLQGHRMTLTIFADKEGGITLDDCAKLSHMLDPLLDQLDILQGSYSLEVSSPGIARPLRKPEDFARFAGEAVKVRAIAPVEGRRGFQGVLRGIEEGMILIESEGQMRRVHLENLDKAHLDR